MHFVHLSIVHMIYLDFAGALSLAAVRGGDGVVGAVGDGPAEVEAEAVLEGQLVRAAPGVHLWMDEVQFEVNFKTG